MKSITQLENKKVLVLGLAKSGEAAARLLAKLGAIVTVNDGKAFEENPSAQSLLEEGIKVVCGGCFCRTHQAGFCAAEPEGAGKYPHCTGRMI